MKYKFIGPKRVHIGELGIVEPGQLFEVNNPKMEEFIFKCGPFEVVKPDVKKVVKKVVIKKEDGE
jgi:hypothetical protein